jgi:hypothetical protein
MVSVIADGAAVGLGSEEAEPAHADVPATRIQVPSAAMQRMIE